MVIQTSLYTVALSMQKIGMEEREWTEGTPFPSGKEPMQNFLHWAPLMNGKDGIEKGIGDLPNGGLPHVICPMNCRPIPATLRKTDDGSK